MEPTRNHATQGQIDLAFPAPNAAKGVGHCHQMAADLGRHSRMCDASLREAWDGGSGTLMVPQLWGWMCQNLSEEAK